MQASLERRPPTTLRPYQDTAFGNLVVYRVNGGNRALYTLATGMGKTELGIRLAMAQKRVIFVMHREELLDQWANALMRVFPGMSFGVEQAENKASSDCKVVFASIQTFAMAPDRLKRFNPSDFSVVFIDEVHHVVSKSYLTFLFHFGLVPDVSDLTDRDLARRDANEVIAARFKSHVVPDWAPFLVGCTATPNRTDGKGLEWVFDDVVFSMDIRKGIEEGWLSPIRGVKVSTGTSIEGVQVRGGDFAEKQLSNAINTDERNALIVHAYEDHAVTPSARDRAMLFDGVPPKSQFKQALVFCVDREHATAVTETFARRGHAVGMVLGNTPGRERERTMNAYRRGDLRVLVNVMVATEGFDVPSTEIVLMARPTKSSLIYTQCLGRGTRVLPGTIDGLETAEARVAAIAASAKPFGLVIDMVDAGKTGVQDLNTMFGLPPKFNLGVVDAVSAARAVEDAAGGMVSQERLLDADSLADVARMAQEFDPIAVAGLPSHIERMTSMAWVKTPSGYSLGALGKGDVGVVVDMLGHGHVRFRPKDGPALDVGEWEDEVAALRGAETYLRDEHDDVAGLLNRRASWRTDLTPPSEAQVRFLSRLGRKDLPPSLTKGGASILIESLLGRKGTR
jgi:superfamily II DNA or RNA helicase